jgi:hypothetical protein
MAQDLTSTPQRTTTPVPVQGPGEHNRSREDDRRQVLGSRHSDTYVFCRSRKSFQKTPKNTLFDGFGRFFDLETAFSTAPRPAHPSDVKLGKRESRCFLTFLKVFDRF